MIQTFVFYLYAFITVASGVMVVSARNPVHSVLFLVLAFFTSAGLFILLGAEFLAMLLIIVYAGAVAVLFLFVVMMLDINYVELKQGFLHYLPLGGVIGLILVVEVIAGFGALHMDAETAAKAVAPAPTDVTNTEALGQLVYTHYVYLFQAAGLVLLVAMIGAIVLTHRRREGVLRQRISGQVNRDPKECVEIRKVETGKGI